MVVGSVQSGKTGNYIGLINKALDAGYKLVVVLAGIHENLRAQTQLRIDEGVLGFDSQKGRRLIGNTSRIGVGLRSREPFAQPTDPPNFGLFASVKTFDLPANRLKVPLFQDATPQTALLPPRIALADNCR
jgi:hypothetical protein